jgi:hypothetical protein
VLAWLLVIGLNPNLWAQSVLNANGHGRQAIKAKLAAIRLDTFQVENLPLSEVIKNLVLQSKRRDPEKRGVNILLSPIYDTAPAPNPSTGAAPTEPVDLAAAPINIPPMTDISLEDALNALVKVAGPPRLKYRLEEYAVVIYPTSETIPLVVRVFKLDPNTFLQGLHSVVGVPFGNISVNAGSGAGGGTGGGGQGNQNSPQTTVPQVQVAPGVLGGQGAQGGIPSVTTTNAMSGIQASVRSFLQGLGIDMTPPKSAFFNDRTGTLVVRATPADLELIEAALVPH